LQSRPAGAIRNAMVALTPDRLGRRAIEQLARFEP
jgi:hypothetical protein